MNEGNSQQKGGKGKDLAEYRRWLQSVKENYEASSKKYSAKRVERMRKSMIRKVETAIRQRTLIPHSYEHAADGPNARKDTEEKADNVSSCFGL